MKLRKIKKQQPNPAISIIIPVYNTQNYLQECLDSLLMQTFADFEILIVNDGSTDNSKDVIMEYFSKDIVLKVIEYTNNMGTSYARNLGIAKACGTYLYIMDSDDYLEKNALELLYEKAIRDDLDLLFFDGKSFYDNEIMYNNYAKSFSEKYIRKERYDQVSSGISLAKEQLKNKEYLMNVPLQFIKRSFFLENNLWFVEGIIYEDNIYTFKGIIAAQRAAYLNECLYNRRLRDDSIMTSKTLFYNVYSYFKNYQMMVCEFSCLKITESERKTLRILIDTVLDNCRRKYRKLDSDEKVIYNFLNDDFKVSFRNLVVDYVRVNNKINKSSKVKMRLEEKLENKKSDLEKIKQSHSYKLSKNVSRVAKILKK